MNQKMIAALLCALLLLSGCSVGQGNGFAAHRTHSEEDYFSTVEHGDIDYDEMKYEHYDLSRFSAFTDAIEDFAKNGGSQKEFNAADEAIVDEMRYLYTLQCLIDLRYTGNPADFDAAAEYQYSCDTYYAADNAYWSAMHTLAVSEHANLLADHYRDWQIEWFEEYDAATDGDTTLNSTEDALEQEYVTLVSADTLDEDAVCDVFVNLVEVRNQMAAKSGYDSYADYAYESLYAKDYTPADGEKIWTAAKEYYAPLLAQYSSDINDASSDLYYGDSIDTDPDTILAAMGDVLPQISKKMDEAFGYLLEHHLYDIAAQEQKMNTGYTTYLYAYHAPFIFNAAYDTYYDYTDLFHEFGHFANFYYTDSDLLFGVADNDLSELQSQGMEILFMEYYDQIFGAENAPIIRADILQSMIYSIVDGAMYDEFQQKVYAEKDLTTDRVREIYDEVYQSYGYVPYDGYETEWMTIDHNFEYPFYYISYATSAISALELFEQSQKSYSHAVDTYLQAAALDCESWYFSEAVEEIGLGDVFAEKTWRATADTVNSALKENF